MNISVNLSPSTAPQCWYRVCQHQCGKNTGLKALCWAAPLPDLNIWLWYLWSEEEVMIHYIQHTLTHEAWGYSCSSPLKCRACCRDLSMNHPPGFTFYPSHTCLLVMVLCTAQITWIELIKTPELFCSLPYFAPNIMKCRVKLLNLCCAES